MQIRAFSVTRKIFKQRVGVDAHIDPLETIGFAENCRKNGPVCRADVGIGPYDSDWKIIQI